MAILVVNAFDWFPQSPIADGASLRIQLQLYPDAGHLFHLIVKSIRIDEDAIDSSYST